MLPSAGEVDLALSIDHFMTLLDPAAAAELKSLLRLLENALPGLVFDGRVRPFTASTTESQDATLRAWRRSRLHLRRGGFKVLCALCSSTYFGDPRVYEAIGYPGPPDYSKPKFGKQRMKPYEFAAANCACAGRYCYHLA